MKSVNIYLFTWQVNYQHAFNINYYCRFIPCGTCDEHVGFDSSSIMCEKCEQWHHVECVDSVDLTTIVDSASNSFEWFCDTCELYRNY